MSLYIHIGTQKTGSTTIQQALYDNRDILANSGIFYPEVAIDDQNKVSHYNSVRGFFSKIENQIEHTNDFVQRVNEISGDVLISAENLSNWPALPAGSSRDDYARKKTSVVRRMQEEFRDKDVKIIICIRNVEGYLKSLFKQHLKVFNKPSRSIDQLLHDFLSVEIIRSDFKLECDIWRGIFNDVRIIDFDQNKNHTLLQSFISAIDRDFSIDHVEIKNVSPDWVDLEQRRFTITTGASVNKIDADLRKNLNSIMENYVVSAIKKQCALYNL